MDNIFDEIDSLSHSPGMENLNTLQGYHKKIKNLISQMKKNVKQNEKLSISNNLLEVNKYQSKLNQYQDFPEDLDCKFLFLDSKRDKGKEVSIEIGGFRATLKQMLQTNLSTDVSRLTTGIGELMDKVRVIATIPTTYIPLCGVDCFGEAEAWIYGKIKTITHTRDCEGHSHHYISTMAKWHLSDQRKRTHLQ